MVPGVIMVTSEVDMSSCLNLPENGVATVLLGCVKEIASSTGQVWNCLTKKQYLLGDDGFIQLICCKDVKEM